MHQTKCFKKVFMMSRIAAICPLSFDDGIPRIDYFLIPYSMFVISLVFFQTIRFFIQPPYFTTIKITIITSNILNCLLCCNLVSSYLCLLLSRGTLKEIFLYFMEADVYFSKLGKKANYEINLIYDFILMSFGSIIYFCEYSLNWGDNFRIIEIIHIHYSVLSAFVSVQPFIKLAGLMKNRFRLLNSTFVELSSYKFGQSEILEIILKLHDILCRACEDLNKSFSVPLLLASCICFFDVFICAHFIITGASNAPLIHIVFQTSSILFHVIRIALLTNVCKTTSDEANQLHILLSERLWNEDIRKIENIGKVEACLLMKRRVEFKGYGFLVLDHTLLLSILGAGTTYLVILLQVGKESAVNTLGSGPNYNVTTAINN
ncbi:Gustatory receptor 79a [Halyomorpha halys]|nr:Gustatory receptor 79a [Halyomorpha halys]